MSLPASVIALANADYGWRAQALCRDTDPVQADCLDFALTTNQDSWIWGGTSEEERRVLRRELVARQKAVAV